MDASTVETMTVRSTFHDFLRSEGIPIIGGYWVEDTRAVEVEPWERLGCLGAYIHLEGTGDTNTAYVAELEPGTRTNPEKHMFEKLVYVLDGQGETTVGEDDAVRFSWRRGSVFSVPLNEVHQHVNTSSSERARLLAVTNAPLVMNFFHSLDFVFNNPYRFEDRWHDPSFFHGEGRLWKAENGRVNVWETNFIEDVAAFETFVWKERGVNSSSVMFELANNTIAGHIAQFPVGTYKKSHRHYPGAHVNIVTGEGYSFMWPRDGDQDSWIRADWKPGSLIVPPHDWNHQHFNTGTTPARYLALRWGSQQFELSLGGTNADLADIPTTQGGTQIDFEDEDPAIHSIFEEELSKRGAVCRMKGHVPGCTGVSDG